MRQRGRRAGSDDTLQSVFRDLLSCFCLLSRQKGNKKAGSSEDQSDNYKFFRRHNYGG